MHVVARVRVLHRQLARFCAKREPVVGCEARAVCGEERGHFPSYNVPYFSQIYEQSGYKETIASRRAAGEPLGVLAGLDYQLAPRAKIFRRDNGKAETFDGFLGVMRYASMQRRSRPNAPAQDPYA